tara:strand:- start:3831 stop:4007 length:177 start_codon:yes stop_codon:yes gene_type:complete
MNTVWQSLTFDEMSELWDWSQTTDAQTTATTQLEAFVRSVEEALKAKNVPCLNASPVF